MNINSKFTRFHLWARGNKWLHFFTLFCRLTLAAGFLPSGFVKITGERFTALAVNHPMGNYLEALHHTGYYYTTIGIAQVTAAILLLIPRTALFGAIIYLPIIFNICLLSLAVRFEGSLLTSPLMLLAVIYLLCWDWHRVRYIFYKSPPPVSLPDRGNLNNRFPAKFFAASFITVVLIVMFLVNIHTLMPRNSLADCTSQCEDVDNPEGCISFCECIHSNGQPLNTCLNTYEITSKASEGNFQSR